MVADTSAEDANSNATRSFMCITSSDKGGVCMEALIGASENSVSTWRLTAAQVSTRLTAPFEAYVADVTADNFSYATTDFNFAGANKDDASDPLLFPLYITDTPET